MGRDLVLFARRTIVSEKVVFEQGEELAKNVGAQQIVLGFAAAN